MVIRKRVRWTFTLIAAFAASQMTLAAAQDGPGEQVAGPNPPPPEVVTAIETAWSVSSESLVADEYWQFASPMGREWRPDYLYRRVCDAAARELAAEEIARLQSSLECDVWRQLDPDLVVCFTVMHPGGGFQVFRRQATGEFVLLADAYSASLLEGPAGCAQQILVDRFWESLLRESCESGPGSEPQPTEVELEALIAGCS